MSHNVPAGKTTDVSHSIGLFIIVHYCHLSPCKGDETHICTTMLYSISPTAIHADTHLYLSSNPVSPNKGLTHNCHTL